MKVAAIGLDIAKLIFQVHGTMLCVRRRLFHKLFDDLKFSRLAIDQISEEEFQKLSRGRGSSRKTDSETVSMEAQIVDSLRNNQLDYQYRSKEQIRKANKTEERLLIDFRKWLTNQGRKLEAAKYGGLRCDGYERNKRILVEAKSSVSRRQIARKLSRVSQEAPPAVFYGPSQL